MEVKHVKLDERIQPLDEADLVLAQHQHAQRWDLLEARDVADRLRVKVGVRVKRVGVRVGVRVRGYLLEARDHADLVVVQVEKDEVR